MALDPRDVFANPCRLVLAPTQPGLLLAYPHGGTPLGYFVRGKHQVEEEAFEVLSEARGRRVAGGRGITRTAFAMVVAQYDAAILDFVYASTTTSAGGYQGANTLTSPDVGATQQPGLITPGSPLLVAPEDTSRPALLIYAPRWSQAGRKEVAYALDQAREESVVVFCDDDATGRDYAVDLLQNMSV